MKRYSLPTLPGALQPDLDPAPLRGLIDSGCRWALEKDQEREAEPKGPVAGWFPRILATAAPR